MPALRLFGRKWLTSSDDFVFPGIFEIVFRVLWLGLISCVLDRYWDTTFYPEKCNEKDGVSVRIYLVSVLVLICLNLVILILLINRSAQGSIIETAKRKHVNPLLITKIFLIIPETILNVYGTIWAFCGTIVCKNGDMFSKVVIEITAILNWIVLSLIIFGFAIVFDPLGSIQYKKGYNVNDGLTETILHKKVSKLWFKRFRWIFCCLRKDKYGNDAFMQVAELLSALFRGTDLVPSDIIAGCILLRVRQKREHQEMRRIRMLNDDGPRFSTDLNRLFSTSPPWMTIKNARHFLRYALSSYGWPMVCYTKCGTSTFHLIKRATCCACFRMSRDVINDNCCFCHLDGVRTMSRLKRIDIFYASFENHVFELPFCLLADHRNKSIVLSIRGSMSFRDIFTDLTAGSVPFSCTGMPDAEAHFGMVACCDNLLKKLTDGNMLDRVMHEYADYTLVLTGHSLGAGVSILLGAKLRDKYPSLQVYSFATPAGLLSREAARYTEQFCFSVGFGDDFVMRLGVESIENIRTSIIETLRACKLPKYRILLNGFGYALFSIPTSDLETTWHDVTEFGEPQNFDPDPMISHELVHSETAVFAREISKRRFAKTRLFTGGRILHIVRRKKTEMEKKNGTGGPTFEMRWATPEEFMEFKIMPKMLLDHLPTNIFRALTTILDQQKSTSASVMSFPDL